MTLSIKRYLVQKLNVGILVDREVLHMVGHDLTLRVDGCSNRYGLESNLALLD